MSIYSLYVLTEPKPNNLIVRYVGISKNVKKRFYVHLENKRDESPHKKNWIAKLNREGRLPECRVLLTGMSFEEACELEAGAIKDFREAGHDLTNLSTGGEGSPGVLVSKETREKLSLAHKGKKHSPEWVEKIRLRHLGTKRTPETCRRISEAKLSKKLKMSAETRRKMSESHQGYRCSPETIEKYKLRWKRWRENRDKQS
jgi:predicted GIY-YIG superfamily endonuclease